MRLHGVRLGVGGQLPELKLARHAGAVLLMMVFGRSLVVVTAVVGGFDVVFGCLRHAGGGVVFQGFWGCWVGSGLRWWLGWCKLFPCCRSARVAPLGWFGLAERWWFENSRACLYYFLESFFDCQSDSRFALFGVE